MFYVNDKRVNETLPIKNWASGHKTVLIRKKHVYTIIWNQNSKKVHSYTNIPVSMLVKCCFLTFNLSDRSPSTYLIQNEDGSTLQSSFTLPFNGISKPLTLVCYSNHTLQREKDNDLFTVIVSPQDTVRDLIRVRLNQNDES